MLVCVTSFFKALRWRREVCDIWKRKKVKKMSPISKGQGAQTTGWNKLFYFVICSSWCPQHNVAFLVDFNFVLLDGEKQKAASERDSKSVNATLGYHQINHYFKYISYHYGKKAVCKLQNILPFTDQAAYHMATAVSRKEAERRLDFPFRDFQLQSAWLHSRSLLLRFTFDEVCFASVT